ncbi:helix-turn-helix transcriptional regulator [Nonomuraea sp. NPDC049750]|uniref:helix-turn-helix domain-containing protein n=1 Tax=Nonomuraea sp. NPDC049750 TaxID=3154738 RepID=UPI0033E77AA4
MARHKAPTARLRRLAVELRQLREQAGLTHLQVAEATGLVPSTLFRLESASARPQVRTLRTLLDVYKVRDERREELEALLKAASEQTWLQPVSEHLPGPYAAYIGFEQEATTLLNYESSFIPGLLQTEKYARAAIIGSAPRASEDEVEGRVAARLKRQELLTRTQPLELQAVIDEAVLRRNVGGRPTMRAQIERLREAAHLPNVTLRVIVFDIGAHPGMYGSFAILRFREARDVVYIESGTSDLFLESQEDIGGYNVMFEHLMARAADADTTEIILARALEQA